MVESIRSEKVSEKSSGLHVVMPRHIYIPLSFIDKSVKPWSSHEIRSFLEERELLEGERVKK